MDAAWPVSKGLRCVRPLAASVHRHVQLAAAQQSARGDPLGTLVPERYADAAHRWRAMEAHVPGDGFQGLTAVVELFRQFLQSVFERDPERLLEHAAMALGRCIVATEKMHTFEDSGESLSENDPDRALAARLLDGCRYADAAEWYESHPAAGLLARWVLLGHGMAVVCKHALALCLALPTLVHVCVDAGAGYLARVLLVRFVESCPSLLYWRLVRGTKGGSYLNTLCRQAEASVDEVRLRGLLRHGAQLWRQSPAVAAQAYAMLEQYPEKAAGVMEVAARALDDQARRSSVEVFVASWFRTRRASTGSAVSRALRGWCRAHHALLRVLLAMDRGARRLPLYEIEQVAATAAAVFPNASVLVQAIQPYTDTHPRLCADVVEVYDNASVFEQRPADLRALVQMLRWVDNLEVDVVDSTPCVPPDPLACLVSQRTEAARGRLGATKHKDLWDRPPPAKQPLASPSTKPSAKRYRPSAPGALI